MPCTTELSSLAFIRKDTTSRDEWTFATFMNSFNFDTYKWGGMDSSPLSHSAPLTANTRIGQDWQRLDETGCWNIGDSRRFKHPWNLERAGIAYFYWVSYTS